MAKSRLFLLVAGMLMGNAGCGRSVPPPNTNSAKVTEDSGLPSKESGEKMKITIGSKMFNVTLADTPAAAELKARLPLTLKMSELNGNEKHGSLSEPLPKKEESPRTIQKGDL